MSGQVHRYRTVLIWGGSTAVGFARYDRTHRLHALAEPDGPPVPGPGAGPAEGGLVLSSDPAFGGDPSILNPEQLLVAAASSCHFLSLLAVAAHKLFDVVSYRDEAVGEMPDGERPMRLTTITLHPHVVFGPSNDGTFPSDEVVARLHATAHRQCFIANSLRTDVVVDASHDVRR